MMEADKRQDAPDTRAPVLEVDRLSLAFLDTAGKPGPAVVRELSFALHFGETLGIVGESGSGKSVTFLALAGLLRAGRYHASGQARFTPRPHEVYSLLEMTEAQRRPLRGKHIGMVFQEPMSALNPVMRCGPQVAEVMEQHLALRRAEARARALEGFAEVALPQPERIFRAYPHELSGGQKQRVVLAMAMACRPALLVADEPTTALDVTVQRTVLDLIGDLQARHGMAVAFISHDLGVVRQVADRVLVMRKGRLVETHSVTAIYEHPQMPYTQALLACRPPIDRDLERLPTVEDWDRGPSSQTEEADPALAFPRLQIRETQPTHEPYLQTEALAVRFATRRSWWGKPLEYFTALHPLTTTVYARETLGVVGESGSGKSTLARALLGLVAGEGRLFCQGQAVDWYRRQIRQQFRRRWQMVFQDPYASLNPRMSLGQALAEAIEVHRLRSGRKAVRARCEELLEQVGLPADWIGRYPHQLSGGQRQRVGIARALAVEPEFLICDEAVSALDTSVQAQVLNQLKALKALYGLTYLFITHDFAVVRFMADRVLVLKDGQVIEQGPARQIIDRPQHEYTRSLVAAVPA
jgi:peptide/nickel transport system ATP-binding protein